MLGYSDWFYEADVSLKIDTGSVVTHRSVVFPQQYIRCFVSYFFMCDMNYFVSCVLCRSKVLYLIL